MKIRYKKTYGIRHLTEKHTAFYLGGLKVHVSFMGGVITKKGVSPATFTTDNEVVQLAIERSDDFINGVIALESAYPIVDKTPPLPMKKSPAIAPKPLPSACSVDSTCSHSTQKLPDFQILEMSCKDVAKQFLEEKFGENPAKLRTRADIADCAAKYGIKFEYP